MLIGMDCLVGTKQLVLVSQYLMQSLRRSSKVQIWKPHFKIWLKPGGEDRLRAFRVSLMLAVIEDAEPKQMRCLSSFERYKAALARQRRALKRVKWNNG